MQKVNLSNAKLLYTNKTLRNPSLNERQKLNIVEAISRTSSVEQTKIIFETLQSTVKGLVEKSKLPESLSEAIKRTNSSMLSVNRDETNIDPAVKRFQILAGIKKV